MSVRGRSARGEDVDFDKLKIKEQLAAAPKTTSVKVREDFVDAKFKRRVKQAQAQTPKVEAVQQTLGVEVDKKQIKDEKKKEKTNDTGTGKSDKTVTK